MDATVEKLERNRVVLEVKVEPQRLENSLNLVYRSLANRSNIPGFRRGKAPRRLVENYFGREYIYNEALDRLIPEAYAEAIEKTKIVPVSRPNVELVQLEEGQPLVFKATVEVKPEVLLGEYKGIMVEKKVRPVGEADVDRFLENMRLRYAKLVDLGEEALAAGDIAIIDFSGAIDGKPFAGGKGEGVAVEVAGPGFWPGFSEQLVGMRCGEEREIKVVVPKNFRESELVGKEVIFNIHIREGKRRELSPLDDEFAKDVSELGTLQELKDDIANRLREEAVREADHQVREQVVTKVTEAAAVEVPSSMVESRVTALLAGMEERLRQQGLDMDEYLRLTNGKLEDVQASFRSEAEGAIKRELVLEAIAEKEGLTVSDTELEQEIAAVAQRTNRDVATVKEQLPVRGWEGLRISLLYEKVTGFLVENARIEVREP